MKTEPSRTEFPRDIRNLHQSFSKELERTALGLEDLSCRLSRLPVGGGLIHQVNNIRMLLRSEITRVRGLSSGLKGSDVGIQEAASLSASLEADGSV